MKSQRFLRHLLCLLFCHAPYALAAPAESLADLQRRQEFAAGRIQQLQQEYEFTQLKRAAAAEKLQQALQERADKDTHLANLRAALGPTPSTEQQASVANEAQRIALADLTIKSQSAALTRLERKEEELRLALAEEQRVIGDTDAALAAARVRLEAETRARNLAMQQQLLALQAENEKLRLAMEEEARRAQAAEAAARQAEQARQQEQARQTQEAAAAKAASMTGLEEVTADPSQTVLEGEPPIHRDQGPTLTLRSRSINTPVVLSAVGPNRYRAEVEVKPGVAFFDVHSRRYRGRFADGEEAAVYIFDYDTSAERPVLSVRKKSTDQMMSTAEDPF